MENNSNTQQITNFQYSDVVVSVMASQITGVSSICSTICSAADQRKHQSSASLALGNPPMTGGFPSHSASNAEIASIWWRHHVCILLWMGLILGPFLFDSSCTLDMFKFPYDKQICALKFGNVVEPAEVVNITTDVDDVDLDLFYPSNEFAVESHRVDTASYQVGISLLFFPWLAQWPLRRKWRWHQYIIISVTTNNWSQTADVFIYFGLKVAEDDIAFKLAILKKSLHLDDNTCFCSIIQSSKLVLGSLLAKK